jgi:hypothetical protein
MDEDATTVARLSVGVARELSRPRLFIRNGLIDCV